MRLLVLSLALAGLVLASRAPSGADAPPAAPAVELGVLRTDPVTWRAREVTLTLQFDAPLSSWNAWTTRFAPERYFGFAAWADEVPLWDADAYANPARRLFVARGSAAARTLEAAPRYRRFEVTAVVRSIFAGEVWIEVLTATPLERSIGEGTILHATRAVALADEGNLAAAREQFDRALAAPMPAHMRAALEAARGALEPAD